MESKIILVFQEKSELHCCQVLFTVTCDWVSTQERNETVMRQVTAGSSLGKQGQTIPSRPEIENALSCMLSSCCCTWCDCDRAERLMRRSLRGLLTPTHFYSNSVQQSETVEFPFLANIHSSQLIHIIYSKLATYHTCGWPLPICGRGQGAVKLKGN